jgi:hypothetical protein
VTNKLDQIESARSHKHVFLQEPKQKSGDNTSVLIIRQITPFGAADLEGHLSLGERIMSVNGEPITKQTIEDIVGLIKPCSVLQLKVYCWFLYIIKYWLKNSKYFLMED